MKITLSLMPDRLAVCRLDVSSEIPSWEIDAGDFFSITKTGEELSVVCLESNVPHHIKAEKGWRGLKVEGPLDFGLTGILYSICKPLAEVKISIFAISTYDTDYVLIKEDKLQDAMAALENHFQINQNALYCS